MTNEEKQKLAEDALNKIDGILKINGLSILNLDSKMLASVVMIYQEGIKDARKLLE